MQILTVTGYKPMEMNIFKPDDERIQFIKGAIRKRIATFAEEGLEWILLSGQMGVELWTAETVMELKDDYNVKLGLIPPFEGQASRWPEPVKQAYEKLTVIADFCRPLYKGKYKGPYQFKARDKWLISKSDACLILMDEEYLGSARFFYKEASQTADYPIFTITPNDIQDVVEEIHMQDPAYWS